jgi:hypothetical protein
MDMVHANFAMSLAALAQGVQAYEGVAHVRIMPEGLINTKGSIIPKSRNTLVAQAQAMKMDYLLFLDSDMMFPQHTLARLLAHDKDIVGAAYVQRVKPYALLAKILGRDRQLVQSGIHEVAGLPTGCLLIKMDVFDKLKKPYFRTPAIEEGQTLREALAATTDGDAIAEQFQHLCVDDGMPKILGEDYYFCAAARAAGFQIWMDIDLTYQVEHVGEKRYKVEYHPTAERADKAPATDGNMAANG